MRPRQAIPQAREFASVLRAARGAYREAPLALARRMRRLRADGWTYTEALHEGLLDPRVPEPIRRRYLSTHVRERRQDVLNPRSLEDFTEEKLTVALYCEGLGLPVPATFGTVGRAGCWNRVRGRFPAGPDGFARMVDDDLPGTFVVKPVLGYLGLGVRVLTRSGPALTDQDGRTLGAETLFRELAADPEFDLFLLQERLHNHPAVEDLVPSPILQTARATTMITAEGTARLLFLSLKLGTGSGAGDNYRAGETGNGVCYADLGTGLLGPAMVPRPGTFGPQPSPDVDGRPVEGRPFPLFAEVCELALRAAPAFLPLRTVGFDIAITPGGPVLVEVNNYWASPHAPLTEEAWDLFWGA